MNSEKSILDVCCGGRMWWHDKEDARAVYMDKRELDTTLCDGRVFRVSPDVIADFRKLPFSNSSFPMVLFDPPHLKTVGKNAWFAQKYGILGDSWRVDLKRFSDASQINFKAVSRGLQYRCKPFFVPIRRGLPRDARHTGKCRHVYKFSSNVWH